MRSMVYEIAENGRPIYSTKREFRASFFNFLLLISFETPDIIGIVENKELIIGVSLIIKLTGSLE